METVGPVLDAIELSEKRHQAWMLKTHPEVAGFHQEPSLVGGNNFYEVVDYIRNPKPDDRKKKTLGVPDKWLHIGLDSIRADNNGQAQVIHELKSIRGLFHGDNMDFRKHSKNCNIYLYGQNGVGKSMLLTGLFNDILDQGVRGLKVEGVMMMNRLIEGNKEGGPTNRYLEQVIASDVLFIDDFDKINPTLYAMSTLFSIINSRYEKLLPTFITCNFSLGELAKGVTAKGGDQALITSIIERIYEDCYIMQLKGCTIRKPR